MSASAGVLLTARRTTAMVANNVCVLMVTSDRKRAASRFFAEEYSLLRDPHRTEGAILCASSHAGRLFLFFEMP
jgi:hypothetical protein